MLRHIARENKEVFVFLYAEDDGRAQKVLRKLEAINDNLENDRVLLVRCAEEGVEDEFGVGYLPRLVHLERDVPVPYVGDLSNEGDVLRWIADVLRDTSVREVSAPVLDRLVEKLDHVAVVFFDADNFAGTLRMLVELEGQHGAMEEEEGLTVVKISTEEHGEELGLADDLPALVQFNDGIPNVYFGQREDGKAMLRWLVEAAEGEVVEEVTAEMVAILREEQEYLGILFSGGDDCDSQDCRDLQEVLASVNARLTAVGIKLVRTRDKGYPFREHEIEDLPALGMYRNGRFLQYRGSSWEAEEVEKWFLDEDNIKIEGRIEEVNARMLSYLYEMDDDIVVLFYETSDRDVDELLDGLETADDRLDGMNVTLVKIDDEGAEDQFGVTELPALIYIQSGIPNVFAGDLFSPKAVLGWIRHEANTTRIHEVSDIVLSRLITKFDHLAAIFYTRDNDPVVEGLQGIADKSLAESIAIVKLHDEEEARKLGLDGDGTGPKEEEDATSVHLVFFQHSVPSLVGADPSRPQAVLEWLVKHKRYPTIEQVTDRMLEMLVTSHEYVAVFFQGRRCEEEEEEQQGRQQQDEEGEAEEGGHQTSEEEGGDAPAGAKESPVDCDQVLAELEGIDDELDEIGILIVTTKDDRVAEDNGDEVA